MSERRNPRAHVDSPQRRAVEKQALVFDWLLRFHYSTPSLLLQRLGLKSRSSARFFQRLKELGLLRSVEVPYLREQLLMLTRAAVTVADDPNFLVPRYNPDAHKINMNNVAHDLAVQRVVLARLQPGADVIPARLQDDHGKRSLKVPDVILVNGTQQKQALEVELTAKSTQRMHMALIDHVRAIRDKRYATVEFIFRDPSLRDYYKRRFDLKEWPIYERNKRGRHVANVRKPFRPDETKGFRERFIFTVEESL